jgi:hypothetical protein
VIKVLVVVKKIPSTFLNYWFNFSVHFTLNQASIQIATGNSVNGSTEIEEQEAINSNQDRIANLRNSILEQELEAALNSEDESQKNSIDSLRRQISITTFTINMYDSL